MLVIIKLAIRSDYTGGGDVRAAGTLWPLIWTANDHHPVRTLKDTRSATIHTIPELCQLTNKLTHSIGRSVGRLVVWWAS